MILQITKYSHFYPSLDYILYHVNLTSQPSQRHAPILLYTNLSIELIFPYATVHIFCNFSSYRYTEYFNTISWRVNLIMILLHRFLIQKVKVYMIQRMWIHWMNHYMIGYTVLWFLVWEEIQPGIIRDCMFTSFSETSKTVMVLR